MEDSEKGCWRDADCTEPGIECSSMGTLRRSRAEARLAEFDTLMGYYDELVETLAALLERAAGLPDSDLREEIRKRIVEARAARERFLMLRSLLWKSTLSNESR